ncbi:hypothetical protein, partial [Enterobacter hormaechei]|uniref:hypothetical protein n=2 Tax=Enterobacter TaxID=547 RepID=UPI0023E39BAD
PPLSFRPSPLLLCPLPRENSPGRWTPSPQEKTRMHTRNVNVKTAAQESTGRCDSNLTTSQFTDLFCWVLAASEGEPQPAIFTPPENATELTLINDECPDYISVWFVDGRPVAAAMPLDNFHRVIPSSLTK